MSKYRLATIKRRPVDSKPDEAKAVVKIVFEAMNPPAATPTSSILEALDVLGVAKPNLGKLMELGEIEPLDHFPFGPDAGKPDWSDEKVKLWLIDSPS